MRIMPRMRSGGLRQPRAATMCCPRDIAVHRTLGDRDLGVAMARNVEAVEDGARRVGAVEGLEVDSGTSLSRRSWHCSRGNERRRGCFVSA